MLVITVFPTFSQFFQVLTQKTPVGSREHCLRVVPQSDQISQSGQAHVWAPVLLVITVGSTFTPFLKGFDCKSTRQESGTGVGTLAEGWTGVRSNSQSGRAHVWDTTVLNLRVITVCSTFTQFLKVLRAKTSVGTREQVSGTVPKGSIRA